MINKKPKAKLCAVCPEMFIPARPLQIVCSHKCAYEFVQPKNINKRYKEMKPKTIKLSELRATARQYFQRWVRLRDHKEPCISCDVTTSQQWDGGHYLKAELYTGLIFDEDNCFKQCCYCNDRLAGNESEYRPRLIKKIGLQRVEELEARKDSSRVYKFTREQLIDLAAEYRERINLLKIKK